VYAVVRPKSKEEQRAEIRSSYSVLHGRDLELKLMRRHLQRAQLEQRCLGVILQGGPGIGKSALVDEFLRGIELNEQDSLDVSEFGRSASPRVIRAQALRHAQHTPYEVLRELVQGLLHIDTDTSDDAQRTMIRHAVLTRFPNAAAQEQRYLLHTLGFFLGLAFEDDLINALSGVRRQSRLFLSLLRLLTRSSEYRPLVILIEDLHWCDASSLAFLRHIFNERPRVPLLFLLTTRPPDLEVAPLDLKELYDHSRIHVEEIVELDQQAALALAHERLGDVAVDGEALSYIFARSGGNPFFIVELVDALRHRGTLEEVGGRVVLGGDDNDAWLPSSLEAAVTARIDQLDSELKQALQRCSVLGEEFEANDAVFLFGEGFRERLRDLSERGLIKPIRRRGRFTGYRFAHTLTYAVAIREVVEEERRSLHNRLADYLLERQYDEGDAIKANTIAHHLEDAGRTEEASRFYLRAVETAIAHNSHLEALRTSNRLLDLIRDNPPMLLQAYRLRDEILRRLGRHQQRLSNLEAWSTLLKTHWHHNEDLHLNLLLKQAEYALDRRQINRAQALANELVTRANLPHHAAVKAHAQRIAAQILSNVGDLDAALATTHRALRTLPEGVPIEQAQAYKLLGDLHWQRGHHRDALQAYNQARDIVRPLNQRDLVERIDINRGLALIGLGRYEQGMLRLHDAVESARSVGYRRLEATVLPNIAFVHKLIGEFKPAQRSVHRAVRLARHVRDEIVMVDAVLTLGQIELEQYQLHRAEKALRRAIELVSRVQQNYLSVQSWLALARTLSDRGARQTLDEALDLGQRALTLAKQNSLDHSVMHAQHLLAIVYLQLGKEVEAEQHHRNVLQFLQQFPVSDREILFFEQAIILERLLGTRRSAAIERLKQDASHALLTTLKGFISASRRQTYLERPRIRRLLDTLPRLQHQVQQPLPPDGSDDIVDA